MNRIVFKKSSKATGLLINLSIDEVSFCVKGANPGAKINLFKSQRLEKEAATFSELFVDPDVREAKNKAHNSFFDMLSTLSDSIGRIAFDPDITAKQRKEMMDKSMSEFTSVFKDKLRDDLTKAKKGDLPMTYEDLIKLLGLKEVSADMEKTLKALVDGAANSEEVAKKIADLQKELEEAKKAKEKNPEAGTSKEKDLIAKAKEAGASKEVIKMLEEQKADNEGLKKQVKDSGTRLDKMEEQNVRKACMQKASNLSFIDKADTLSECLYELKKVCSETLYATVEKLLETVNGKLKESKLFKIIGKDGELSTDTASIEAKVETMAKEIVAKDSVTIEVAKARVWQNNPEIYKEYEDAKKLEIQNR